MGGQGIRTNSVRFCRHRIGDPGSVNPRATPEPRRLPRAARPVRSVAMTLASTPRPRERHLANGAAVSLLAALVVLSSAPFAARGAWAEDAPAPAPPPSRGAPAPEPTPARRDDGPVVLREALRLPGVGSGARSLVHTDPVEALLVAGEWRRPRTGQELELPDGTMRRWTEVKADEKGEWN